MSDATLVGAYSPSRRRMTSTAAMQMYGMRAGMMALVFRFVDKCGQSWRAFSEGASFWAFFCNLCSDRQRILVFWQWKEVGGQFLIAVAHLVVRQGSSGMPQRAESLEQRVSVPEMG